MWQSGKRKDISGNWEQEREERYSRQEKEKKRNDKSGKLKRNMIWQFEIGKEIYGCQEQANTYISVRKIRKQEKRKLKAKIVRLKLFCPVRC